MTTTFKHAPTPAFMLADHGEPTSWPDIGWPDSQINTRPAPVCTQSLDIDLSEPPAVAAPDSWSRISVILAFSLLVLCTVIVAAGSMGWAYARWTH